MGSPVVHFEVMGSDAERLADFYTGVFGWRVKHGPDAGDPLEYRMIATGDGAMPEGGIGRSPEGRGVVTFYIDVENLETSLAAIESAGGRTVNGRTEVGPEVAIAMFADPEGNVVGLVEQ